MTAITMPLLELIWYCFPSEHSKCYLMICEACETQLWLLTAFCVNEPVSKKFGGLDLVETATRESICHCCMPMTGGRVPPCTLSSL